MAQATLLQGTLDLLILRTLAIGERHGVAIADRIRQVTGAAFDVKPGSLFPALYRLEADGWVSAKWGESPNGRRVKLYTLTPAGRRHLADEKKSWERTALAMRQVLDM